MNNTIKHMQKLAGIINENQEIDLFQDYKNIPPQVQKILNTYLDMNSDQQDYRNLEKALKELEKIGYTFEYYLDGVPYNLRKINK